MQRTALPGLRSDQPGRAAHAERRTTLRLPEGRYVAVLGGSETCGRGMEEPWPLRLGSELGVPCVNLGQHNASVELVLRDAELMAACRGAALTVVAVTGAANLSNRLYAVHPRRNDRFLKASPALRALFPEVDFAEICFTRHLLLSLHAAAPDRFGIVRDELRKAWAARMRTLLQRIEGPALVLWGAAMASGSGEEQDVLGADPLFVTAAMAGKAASLATGFVQVPRPSRGEGLAEAHARIAGALVGPVGGLMPLGQGVRARA